jgi:hypothetical protein
MLGSLIAHRDRAGLDERPTLDQMRSTYAHLTDCDPDLDIALFPAARQLVSITRHYCLKNSAGDFKSETRHMRRRCRMRQQQIPIA